MCMHAPKIFLSLLGGALPVPIRARHELVKGFLPWRRGSARGIARRPPALGERVLVGCSQLDECFVRSAILVGVSLMREQPIRRLYLHGRRRPRDAEDSVWIGARHTIDGGYRF
ncbi:MAG: hypothetical protein FD172_3740 [Methylocystaceae bacterium]|nr:MAG: hypothetical protein FD172_3740 [Methylocystaceae bacterium]